MNDTRERVKRLLMSGGTVSQIDALPGWPVPSIAYYLKALERA